MKESREMTQFLVQSRDGGRTGNVSDARSA